ncbi:MAG TPA: type II secretion system F family protein, partial [Phycisphaerae bacterium]|nr:type II secretion system F family protein [Phycisphaerae bacterium]
SSAGTFVLPLLWLLRRRKKRIRALVEQLPDVFDLMGQALRAGHALSGAIQLISQQMPRPVGKEFARVFQEQNLGIKIEEALLNMAQRVDQMDVRFFVTAVLIQRQTGGDLAEVLDKIGKVIRDRIQLLGTVQALTAEGRLSGWVLLALPVVVFFACFMVNPDYARVLIETPHGRMMLAVAAAMDLMGMAMIKKIVNIKV